MTNENNIRNAEENLERAEAELKAAEAKESEALTAEREALRHVEEAAAELKEAERSEIRFKVNGEDCETWEHELTPNQIIKDFARKDPATNYLVQIEGARKVSYKGKGEERIKLREGDCFQTVSTGPTPVSAPTGAEVFAEGLRALGYDPRLLPRHVDHVVFDYTVEAGLFNGQLVRLGFIVPGDFPNTTPSGPNVSPKLLPHNPNQAPGHPRGGIHEARTAFFGLEAGGEWQYWSRPCSDWGSSKKTVTVYMTHIWRLWETQ